MDLEPARNSISEAVRKDMKEMIYASVEKAIQTLLVDQGYLMRGHHRGPPHGRRMMGMTPEGGKTMPPPPHHRGGPPREMGGERGGPRPVGVHKGWMRRPHGHHPGRRFPFAMWHGRGPARGDDGSEDEGLEFPELEPTPDRELQTGIEQMNGNDGANGQ